jgi:serine/threonine-protein kinase
MAPEQFDGSASPASDIYALGIIAYQLLTGEVPFQGATMAEYMIAKLSNPIPPMHQVNPICDCTELLENLVYGMLARSPADRPSLEEVFSHLARCEEEVFGSNGARLAHSGSVSRPNLGGGPSTPRSSQSIGALKVPYTIVAPQPMRPGSTGSGISAVQLHQLTGATQSAMSTSHPPLPMPAKRAFPLAALLAIVFGIVAIGGTGIWVAKSRLSSKPPTATSATTAGSSPSAPVETATAFVLHLDSTPSGAAVSEDGNVLGTTPLDIKIERASVKTGQRSFQIKKEGFLATVYAQKDSDSRVDQTVTLAADTSKPAKTPHAVSGKAATAPGTKPQPPAGGPDIRLTR